MSHQDLIGLMEEGIDRLVQTFLDKPYSFYSENDLHCALYNLLDKMGLNRDCRAKAGERVVTSTLLHKEYPTKGRYRRRNDGPSHKVEKGSRGHFDLCLWDPELAEERIIRRSGGVGEQRTLAAVELSLNEHHKRFLWHVYWDWLKLCDPENEVEKGVILFFVRDYPYKRVKFPRDGFIRMLHDKFGNEDRIDILYIERYLDERVVWLISDTSFRDYKRFGG